jgi:hypothetical protein
MSQRGGRRAPAEGCFSARLPDVLKKENQPFTISSMRNMIRRNVTVRVSSMASAFFGVALHETARQLLQAAEIESAREGKQGVSVKHLAHAIQRHEDFKFLFPGVISNGLNKNRRGVKPPSSLLPQQEALMLAVDTAKKESRSRRKRKLASAALRADKGEGSSRSSKKSGSRRSRTPSRKASKKSRAS